MGNFIKGDIVVLNFPFSNLSATKKRPAFVLTNLGYGDIILCQITSKPAKNDYSIKIEQNDFEVGLLPLASFIRTDKFFTANEDLILYKAGRIKQEKIELIVQTAISVISK
ncbi:MAG: type II toxin-antitoxin system PemK/MazF family toxin [Fibromonadaceae bacterium]|jgi:mRNA interferase MazF|nr:type II toxin-antitoxin system PemK/MazF family toxin [Fibromonadaceae bacterium]